MDKRELLKAIKKGIMFTGANIPLPKGERVLVSDMLMMIKQIESDKNRISISGIGELHQVVEILNDQLLLSWVLVPSNQGSLPFRPEVGFGESILEEIREKIDAATEVALSSIDLGNQIAADSAVKKITAGEVIGLLKKSKDARIVSEVVARADGRQADLFFNNDIRSLGGIPDAQKEFTNSERFRIGGCKIIRWLNDREVFVSVENIPEDPEISAFICNSKTSFRSPAGARESAILRCAAFTESAFDVEVSIGLGIKKRKKVLHLARIVDPSKIFCLARDRLDELDE